jgi:hypothetical protein
MLLETISSAVGPLLAAVLMVIGPLLTLVLMVAVPVLFGMMAYDLYKNREQRVVKVATEEELSVWSESKRNRIQLERGIARAFVILGGVFWAIAAFAGLYSYRETGAASAFLAAAAPLGAAATVLVIGWYWERLAAIMLAAASVAVIYWGVVSGFEPGVWMLMTILLIGPMVTAAVLFWMARSELKALEFRLANADLAFATVK